MPDKSYKIGEDTFDIPEAEVGSFLKYNPKAVEIQSYAHGKDTFDIPIHESADFLNQFPEARPLKKKEQTISLSGTTTSKELQKESGGVLEKLTSPVKSQLESASSTLGLDKLKSESTEPKEYGVTVSDSGPSAKSPVSSYTLHSSQKKIVEGELAQKQALVEKDYSDTDSAYQELKGRMTPYTEVLNNPAADPLEKQFAQSKLAEMAPEIQAVQAKKDAYENEFKKFTSDVSESTKRLKDIANQNDSYLQGAGKSFAQGAADIIDAMQGANDFVSKYLFGYEVEGKGGYSVLAQHLREGAENNLENVPANLGGKIVSGVAGSIPIILATAVAPETAIPKFATTMGAISFGKSYQENKDVLKAVKEGGYGLTEGAILHGLGIGGEKIGEWVSKTKVGEAIGKELSGKSAAGLITALGFGGEDAAKQFLETGKVDLEQVAASAGTGLAFSLSGIAKAAYEKAFTKTITTPSSIVTEAINIPKSTVELRDEASKALEDGIGKNPEDKAKAFLVSKSLSSIADMKAIGEDIANNPTSHISDVIKSDMSPEQKQAAISNINAIVEQNNVNIKEAEPLKQEKANLESQLESAKVIENPELRDAEINRITSEISDKQSEIEKVLSKPIPKTTNEKTSKESGQEKGSEKRQEIISSQAPGVKEVATEELTSPATKGAVGEVLTPEGEIAESYIHNLPDVEMNKLADELKQADTKEKSDILKTQFEENSGSKITDEQWNKLREQSKSFVPDEDTLTLKPQENAIKEGEIKQGGQPEYIGAETQRLQTETSDSNSTTQSGEKSPEEKVKNIQALPDEDYVTAFIDSGQLASVGTHNMRMDIGHIFQGKGTISENLSRAIKSIKSGGKLTADAQRLKEVILRTKHTGNVPMIQGVGGTSRGQGVDIPIQQFHEDISKSAPEPTSQGPEGVSHKGENYLIERDSDGNISDIKTKEGVLVLESGISLKDYNSIKKIAEVKKNDVAAVSKVVGKSEIAAMGLEEMAKSEPRRWEAVAKEAKDKVDSGEVNPMRLLDELERHPRTLSDTEIAILVRNKVDMKKNYNDVLKQISEAKEGEDITNLLVKQASLEEEAVKFEKAFNDVIRPSAGRSLAALNMMMKPDYSLFNVMSRGKAAEVGGIMPERIKEILTNRANKISELEKEIEESKVKLQEVYKELSPEFKKTDASKDIRRQKYIQEAEERKSGRKVTKGEIQAERSQIFENLKKLSIEQRSTLSANPINAKMVVEIGKLVSTYVKEGVVDFAQIVDDIHLKLKDIVPNVKREDVENAITEASIKEALAEEKELSIDTLYDKFKLGVDRTIDEVKKTVKNKDVAKAKIKEIEKNSDYFKQFYEKAKRDEIEKNRAEKKIEDTLKDRKDLKRPVLIKALEGIKNVYKALILSGVKTPIKLASAVVNILALKPAYIGMGNLLAKIPLVGDIYKKAPVQKMGTSAIAKYYSTLGSKEMFKESYRTLLGKSHFDAKNIDKQYHDSKILGFPGRFHAAIKVFAKLPEYEAAKKSLVEQTIKNGEDPFTDTKMAEIEELSVNNALNAVLMDDNKVASLWNNTILSASKSKNDGIKALAELLSVEDPIVRVPLNQAAAIWEHIPVLGLLNRIGEIKRGAKQEGGLTPEQANEIARNINRQGLGLLIGGLGALYYNNLGGFQDWRSKKDKEIGVEELGVKINELELPKILFHNAAWDMAQMSATIARENEEGRSGIVGGAGKAAVGVAEESIPFVRTAEEIAKTTQALKQGKLSVEAGKFVSKLISTSDTRKLAKTIDDERKTNPQGFWEAVANDIPGLRKYVTGANDVEFAKRWARHEGKKIPLSEDEKNKKVESFKVRHEKAKLYNEWRKENKLK